MNGLQCEMKMEAPSEIGASPAVLRLQLLDLLRNETTQINASGSAQINQIQRAMVDRPSSSLADVLAKLRTARMSRGIWSDRMDLKLIESAIADLERLPAL